MSKLLEINFYYITWQVVVIKKLEDKVNKQKPKDPKRIGKKIYSI